MEHNRLWMAIWVTDMGEPSNYSFVSREKTEEEVRKELVPLLRKEWDWEDDDEDTKDWTAEQWFDQWDMYGLYVFPIEDETDKDGNDYKITVTPCTKN